MKEKRHEDTLEEPLKGIIPLYPFEVLVAITEPICYKLMCLQQNIFGEKCGDWYYKLFWFLYVPGGRYYDGSTDEEKNGY